MTWQIVSVLVVIFVASAGLIGDLFHHARERQWLVVPGKRSSHATPTPSGAGLVVVLMVLAGAGALRGLGMMETNILLAILVGGGAIAFVSWLDDIHGVPARFRLLTQFAAALAVLWWVDPITQLDAGIGVVRFGYILGSFLTVLGVIWASNVVNFMDGTDGLVGVQTVFVSAVLGGYLFHIGALSSALLLFVLAAATAGFLAWNWHPAKVFLGDVGAVFIGFFFALLAVWHETSHILPLLVWAMLLAPFIVDATLSTARRVLHGHPVLEGHREFAFHRAVRRGLSHAQVALVFLLIDVLLLLPLTLSLVNRTFLLPLTLVVYIICGGLWWFVQKSEQPFAVRGYHTKTPTRRQRIFLFLVADVFIVVGSLTVAFLLRFDFALTRSEEQLLILSIPSFLVVKLLSFWYYGIYKMRWHAVGLHDLYNIIKAVVFSSAVLAVMIFLFQSTWFVNFPRSVFLIDGTLTFLLLASLRISRRMFHEVMRGQRPRIRPQELGDFTVEEYFGKAGFALDEERLAQILKGKNVLVTGAAGSLGRELAISLCRYATTRVVSLDHDETRLADLERELTRRYGVQSERIAFAIADVRDQDRVDQIITKERPDIIFHGAGYKQSCLMERDVEEAVKANVLGTAHVAKAAVAAGTEWFVYLSDAAVRSRTSIGMTKALAESICLGLGQSSLTSFLCVRFGNVLGSRGGVLSVFLEQIGRGEPITLTNPEAERRVMTVKETAAGILQTLTVQKPGTMLIEGGHVINMQDFAETLIRLHGLEPYRDVEIRVIGARVGERPTAILGSRKRATDHPALFAIETSETWNEEEVEAMLSDVERSLQFGAMHQVALMRMYEQHILGRAQQTSNTVSLGLSEDEEYPH